MSMDDRDSGEHPTATSSPSIRRFFAELKRRHVFRAAAVYGAIGFTVIEVTEAIVPHLGIPERAITLVVWLVLFGYPLALVLAWAFESASDGGVRRTRRPANRLLYLPAGYASLFHDRVSSVADFATVASSLAGGSESSPESANAAPHSIYSARGLLRKPFIINGGRGGG